MKITENNIINYDEQDEMLEHYDFDYSQTKPNRFALLLAEQDGFIKLQPDIRDFYHTTEEVNNALSKLFRRNLN
jgi:hypothetical protein